MGSSIPLVSVQTSSQYLLLDHFNPNSPDFLSKSINNINWIFYRILTQCFWLLPPSSFSPCLKRPMKTIKDTSQIVNSTTGKHSSMIMALAMTNKSNGVRSSLVTSSKLRRIKKYLPMYYVLRRQKTQCLYLLWTWMGRQISRRGSFHSWLNKLVTSQDTLNAKSQMLTLNTGMEISFLKSYKKIFWIAVSKMSC